MTTRRFASAVLLLSALAGAARAQAGASLPDGWLGPGPLHKLIVGPDDPAKAWFEALGAVRTEIDYGAFELLVVDEAPVGGQAGLLASGFRCADEQSLIPLNGYRLDGTRPYETLALLDPAERIEESPLLDPLAGLYLVQFIGPVRDEWLAGLQATGARLVQYVAMNGYVVAADPGAVSALLGWRAAEPAVQHLGIWQPGYRLAPALRAAAAAGATQPVPVTIQLVEGPGAMPLVDVLRQVAASVPLVVEAEPYLNVQADLAPVWFRALAHQPEVFAVGPRGVRKRQDERQGQTVAGNVSGSGPSAPGYLAWLASAGFDSSQFTSFAVNVVDDSTSLTGHPDLPSSRVVFTFNPTSQSGSQPGHGFLNANIVAGFNDGSGSALVDSGSYHYGLGIAPWAQVGSTAIFGSGSATETSWESTAYNAGARISTNSWTFVDQFQNPIPDYESEAQTYDKIVRDARSGTAGNQEYVVVFAASNNGPGANSVSTPATAKNVITVAASENNRQTGTDGCGIGNTGANNVNDIIDFSSHGPVNSAGGDGRWKPEIAAPGTHIQAGVPQSNYNGSGICNQFFPSGQTLYSWSSGTSHSTPAVAGGAALVRQWFLNHALPASSPAMTKAMLVNSAEYMTGNFANDTLPSNSQGMGRMNLGRAFDGSQRVLVDETNLLASTGASYSVSGSVSDSSKPFRVTLVWTDAPGPTTGAPWVNNLDLSVAVGGSTYAGNVFSGAASTTGGSADIRNNTESVFRPAGTSGPFTVTVTAAAIAGDGVPGNGDSTDQDFALVVYNGSTVAAPVANFSGSPTSGVKPLAVSFTDQSTGSITSWAWTFGDGGTSTAQNPSHTYNTAGTFTVALTATGPGGSNTNTKTNYVTVSEPPPVASFSGSPTSGNKPLAVSFTNTTTGVATTWAWTFGDGGTSTAQNPSHTYNTAGTFTVALTATGPGGSNTNTKTNYITVSEPPPVANFSGTPTSGTKPLLVAFTDSSTNATSWAWTFGDGGTSTAQNPSHTYLAAGSYTVALTATGPGGSNTNTKTNYVTVSEPAPVADFSGTPTSGIKPLLVSFTDLSTNPVTSWAWTFGDGGTSTAQNPSHTYAAAGSYTVALTATGPGGNNTKTKTAYITVSEPAPVANFSGSPTSGTKPLVVSFTDQSTNPVTSWAWAFGDGGTSTAQNPSHTYAAAGTFTVALTATGPGGSNTLTKSNYVSVSEPAPVASFSGTPTSGSKPLLVSFTDASTNATSWAWTFGDGGTSTAQNPSHTYNAAGTYTVALTATGPGGSDTLTKTNYVAVSEPAPVANFSGAPTSGTKPLLVNFTDLSTNPVTSWAWTFGDGGTSTLQNPSHTYNAAGIYTVALTATGPGGTDTLTKTGYVVVGEPAPVAAFTGTPTAGVVPLLVSFTDQSSNAVTSWAWDFGDGGTSTLQNPTHTYTAAGSYTVALTVSGPGGTDTETQSGYVVVSEPAPVADFSGAPISGSAPLDVAFTDLSSGPIATWAWTFGDGGSSSLPSPHHVYTTGGSFTVSLTVTGPGGSDTTTKTSYVTVSAGAFVPYGSGSGGAAGVPVLSGAGDLTPGSVPGFDLALGSAPPFAPIILFVGAASASVPLKGQTLLVFPIVSQIGLGATNGAGAMTLHSKVPAGTPAVSVYLQAWLVDPTGTAGFSSSNGLRLDVP